MVSVHRHLKCAICMVSIAERYGNNGLLGRTMMANAGGTARAISGDGSACGRQAYTAEPS
jgi:hypothetical protein